MLANKYTRVSAIIRIVFTCFLIVSTCIFSLVAQAQISDYALTQNHEIEIHNPRQSLESQVYAFIEGKLYQDGYVENNDDLKIQVREIDERINIPFCASPFEFSTNTNPQQQSNLSIKVSCNNTNWYLFMHASVALIQKVVVSSENLSPGTLLSHANLELVEMDKNKLRGTTFNSIEDIVGARIKRRTRSGNIIGDRMLCFICKGDRVTIAAVSAGLSIKVYGVAEEDGVLGDTIQVRNISSDKLVFAKIASTSLVEINI